MYPIQITRGGEGSNLNSSSASSNKSKFFKPVVASSLALLLTAGIASAQCDAIDTANSKNGICFDGTLLDDSKLASFSWEGDNGVVSPKSATTGDISTLLFQFNAGATSSDPSGSFDEAKKTYTIVSNKDEGVFELNSGEKAIKIPSATDGKKGALEIDFGEGTKPRSFTLDLSAVTHNGFAFDGDIKVKEGTADRTGAVFSADFGKDMIGNITIGEKALSSSDITFKDGANFDGDFSAESGENLITFEKKADAISVITGKVEAKKEASNLIDFRGDNNEINGSLIAEEGGINLVETSKSTSNTTPDKDDPNEQASLTIGGNITANKGGNAVVVGKDLSVGGSVEATGEQKTTPDIGNTLKAQNITINGGISATGEGTKQDDLNKITAKEKLTIKAKDTTKPFDGEASATRDITATKGGTNTITAKTVDINVDTISATDEHSANIITFDDGSFNAGAITATQKGNNRIVFDAGSLNAGSVSADGEASANTIELAGSGDTDGLNVFGSVSVENGGINTFEASDATFTLKSATKDALEIKANGEDSQNKITTKNAKFDLDKLTASTKGENTITASEKITITKGALSATEGGTNDFTSATLDATNIASITAKGENSANTIETTGSDKSSLTVDGAMTATQKGKNEITLAGAGSTIKSGSITAGEKGENLISITGADSKITIGTLEANKGYNSIKLEDGAGFKATSVEVTGDADTNATFKDGNNIIDILKKGSSVEVDNLVAKDGKAGTNGANVFAFREGGEITINNGYTAENDGANIIASVIPGTPGTPTEGLQLLLDNNEKINGKSIVETYGESFKKANEDSLLKVKVEQDTAKSNHTFTITGLATGSISKINDNLTSVKLNLETSSVFAGSAAGITDTNPTPPVLEVEMNKGSKLLLKDEHLQAKTLTLTGAKFNASQVSKDSLSQTNTIIDLASIDRENPKHFRLLEVGDSANATDTGLKGENGLFVVSVNSGGENKNNKLAGGDAKQGTDTYGFAYSDRVIVHNVLDANGTATKPITQHLQINPVGMTLKDMENVKYISKDEKGEGTKTKGNIAVFTVKNDAKGQALVKLKTQEESLVGYDVVETKLKSDETDDKGIAGNNKNGYTTYFIKSMANQGASKANQQTALTALLTNHDLYLANMNSLNKRMGELRENTGAQGAWARIFNGMQTTSFALDTTSLYTTIQGGYDYTFGFKGASNYLGFALSYANALGYSESSRDINGIEKGLRNTNANAFEFAIYNAYVQDGASKATGWKNGLYSDSILKLSFISSNITLLDQTDKTYNTSNLGVTFSQELGYRFLLGENKSFYIDPQAEIALGLLTANALHQEKDGFELKATQEAILNLRSRIGSSFGYKFDEFTQDKNFKASLYLGTYFVSDIFSGGDVTIVTDGKTLEGIKPLESTARLVLNVGTNFKIKDNTRIYFDFEKSFGGLIVTNYQINLGVRYSFGTSAYAPYAETSTKEIKDTNAIKEVEPTKGYYIEVLEKEDKKLSSKETKTLQNIKEELRVQTKTQDNKTLKTYLVGPFVDEDKAKEAKENLEGVLKELKGSGNVIEVE